MPLMMNFLRIEHVKLTFGGVVEPDMIFAHIFGISCFKYHLTRLYNIRVHRNTNGKFYFTQHHIPRDFSQIRITGNHGQGTTHAFGNSFSGTQISEVFGRQRHIRVPEVCSRKHCLKLFTVFTGREVQQNFAQTEDSKTK